MKTSLALGSALALFLVSGVSSAAITTYKATLNGAQETPPVVTAATGTATFTFNDATNGGNARRLQGTITFTGLTNVTDQHIHQAACGTAGGQIKTLDDPNGNTITVDEQLSAAEAKALVAGELYVNIHTQANGDGEIRGQLFLDGSGKTCPAGGDAGADAGAGYSGTDSGSSGSSGTSGTSGTSGASGTSGTSGSNGATTTPADAGEGEVPADDGGGCTTSGTGSTGDGLAMAGLAGLGLAVVMRARGRKSNAKKR